MQIIIEYESSWRNSFLEGSNNEPLPKQKDGTYRKFIGSMTNLSNEKNFIQRSVTIDTVMGLLNRLIGDQRKLYQAREQDNYYFKEIEALIEFQDKASTTNHETTYIRNMTGSTDQNSYTGMIKVNDPIFQSDYSSEFWGVLALDLDELCGFIVNNTEISTDINTDPLSIIARLEELNKFNPVENTEQINAAFLQLKSHFEKFNGLNKKELVLPISLYCSALYLQLERLARNKKYDMSSAKTKAGGVSGISNNGFTKKDFMDRYTTGEKKKVWGNPYIREEFIKGEGKVRRMLTKASGQLEIHLNIPNEKARELKDLIDNAGVSSFYLGKKGLAYVSAIRV
ncbi:MAG: type I-Fv CRISPR-associated protein Cas5fv [Methylococcales bacterium]|nr:type I-Fv CRISPR-associated protein Cas5fv [Methylococcales bacterium]